MNLRQRWAELRLALGLLTRLPVGAITPCPPMGAAVWAYPLAGIAPGLAAGLALWAAGAAGLPPGAAALLALAAGALVTGGLHEDGLADLTDGLSGGGTRERRLDIMRDSRIGSHGALALILATGLRAGALAALHGGAVLTVPLAAAMVSRAGLGPVMRALPPARPGGLGDSAARGSSPARAGAGAAIAAAGCLALLGMGPAIAAMIAGTIATAGVSLLARARLGGYSGDVLGAAQVAAETAVLLVLCRA